MPTRTTGGDNTEVATYYPEDEEYLIDRETTVTQYGPAPTPGSEA
jgi:hypothetical protein